MAFTFSSFRGSSTSASLSLLLLLLSSITLTFAQWTLIGDFEPGRGSDQQRQMAMDQWQGKTSAIQMFFTSWNTQEMEWMWKSLADIYSQGHIPIISWEPWQHEGQSPNDIEILIPQGRYNSYIDTWGGQLKDWLAGPDGKWNTADDRRAYMRFAHEMNGNWYPWSASNGQSTPADYANMWRFVKTRLDNMGIDKKHMQWIFSGICIDVGGFKIEDYYPGDDYVDWIGLGGMNFGYSEANMGWNAPNFLFNSMIDRLRAVSHYSKPFGITEYCSVTNGGGVTGKNQWLSDLFEVVEQKNVNMLVYFNLDKSEGASGGLKDWMVFGGVNGDETFDYQGRGFKAYSAYRQNVKKETIIGSDMSLTNRWISDDLWYGTGGSCTTSAQCVDGFVCQKGACIKEGSVPVPSKNPEPEEEEPEEEVPSAEDPEEEEPEEPEEPEEDPTPSPSEEPEEPYPSTPAVPTKKPKVVLVIYSDAVKRLNVTKIGSRTTISLNKLDESTTEGDKVLEARVSKQEGGIKIVRVTPLDITKFKSLQFGLKSTTTGNLVKVTDSKGRVCQRWVFGRRNVWNTFKLTPNSLKGKCDKTDLTGVFGLTIPNTGNITLDNIFYRT